MGISRRQMKFAAFLYGDCNYHITGWRHPHSWADAGLNFERWIEIARTLERGKFDMLFIADGLSAIGVDEPDSFSRTARNFGFEPFTTLSALSQVTKNLGLAATASTTWNEPYPLARMFASLDRISGGRAGWNLVTGRNPEDAANMSREEHVQHGDRYARAEEFIDVCRGLWDSYADDAFIMDKDSGRFLDQDKFQLLNHRGDLFGVKGPLNVPRPVQGHPVVIQAGMSEPARALTARVADCMFTAQSDLQVAREFYTGIKAKVEEFGRSPDALKILPGVSVYVGASESEAQEKFESLQQTIPAAFAIKSLGDTLGADFSGFPLDGPIPPLKPSKMQINPEQTARTARAKNMNLLQFAQMMATSKSHNIVIGTPTMVADQLQEWFEGGAADGFNLLPPQIPGSIIDFVDLVIPELQRRGLFRHEYEGDTLRENLGLARPQSKL